MVALHSRRSFLALAGTATGLAGHASGNARRTTRDSTTPATTTGDAPATGTTTGHPTTAGATDDQPTGTTDDPPTETTTPAAPLGDHPTFGGGPARTGHAPDERGPRPPVASRWCVGAGGSNRLTPLAVVDGTVFSGSPATGLRALDAATGEIEWRARLESYPDAPTVVGDRVFTSDGRTAYALGRESGRELWSASVGDRVTTSALVTAAEGGDPTVFVGSVDTDDSGERTGGHVHALDATDGSTQWTTPTPDGNVFGALAAGDGVVYGGGSTYAFYAFDAETGERRWRAELDDHATSPAVGPESVFVGDEPGTVYALDPADGSERWTYDVGTTVRTSPAIADGTVYVAATDGYLYALDAETGDRRWRFDGGRQLTCSPTVIGGKDSETPTVFVGSEQGNVFAVDAATGERRWSFHLAERVETPSVVVDGRVFVGDGEGRVHALVGESASTPDGGGRCRADRTTTRTSETRDTDGDGVADQQDYAPRDASVQRRSDLETGDQDAREGRADGGFLAGVAVGTAVAVVGAGSGWWLRSRGEDE